MNTSGKTSAGLASAMIGLIFGLLAFCLFYIFKQPSIGIFAILFSLVAIILSIVGLVNATRKKGPVALAIVALTIGGIALPYTLVTTAARGFTSFAEQQLDGLEEAFEDNEFWDEIDEDLEDALEDIDVVTDDMEEALDEIDDIEGEFENITNEVSEDLEGSDKELENELMDMDDDFEDEINDAENQ